MEPWLSKYVMTKHHIVGHTKPENKSVYQLLSFSAVDIGGRITAANHYSRLRAGRSILPRTLMR